MCTCLCIQTKTKWTDTNWNSTRQPIYSQRECFAHARRYEITFHSHDWLRLPANGLFLFAFIGIGQGIRAFGYSWINNTPHWCWHQLQCEMLISFLSDMPWNMIFFVSDPSTVSEYALGYFLLTWEQLIVPFLIQSWWHVCQHGTLKNSAVELKCNLSPWRLCK